MKTETQAKYYMLAANEAKQKKAIFSHYMHSAAIGNLFRENWPAFAGDLDADFMEKLFSELKEMHERHLGIPLEWPMAPDPPLLPEGLNKDREGKCNFIFETARTLGLSDNDIQEALDKRKAQP